MNGFGTVLILLLFSDVDLDLQRCPYGMNRKIRAKLICSEENHYHCILDKNSHIHIEICRNPKYYRKGFRPVHKGNIDAEKCAFDNFSPGSIQSNESDKCTYIKSNCTDEGQLVFKNGSTETDRSCHCDYKRGYAFIIPPKNQSSCFPFDEDCSCYLKKCRDKRQVLTPDYVCTEGFNDFNVVSYPSITIDRIENKSTEASHTNKTEKTVKSKWKKPFLIMVSVCLTALLVVIILLCLLNDFENKQSQLQKTESIMEIVTQNDFENKQSQLQKTESNMVIVTQKDSDMNETQCIDNDDFDNKQTQLLKIESKMDTVIDKDSDMNATDGNWTDASLGMMNVVVYFQEIKQLKEIRLADCNPETRLIILIGPNGAGKTQAAHKFCWECKDKYFIIGKLTATTKVSIKDSMKKLASLLSLKLSQECSNNEVEFFEDIASLLVNYFNHKNRSKYSYLLFIDDVHFENIDTDPLYGLIVRLMRDVKLLKIIITTLTHNLLSDFDKKRQEIHFNGMSRDEYLSFFRETDCFKDKTDENIDTLVQSTGALPITVNSARKYIGHLNLSIEYYLEILKEVEERSDEKYTAELGENVIPPLLVSFKRTINELKEKYKDITEVIMLLRYLDYKALWPDIIEICYRHYSADKSIAKTAAAAIVTGFLKYSLCYFVKKSKGNMLSFHPETMLALKVFDKDENRKTDIERLCFLIQLFCFEIDIDVRVDISMDRNFLFLDHARKVVNQLQVDRKKDDGVIEHGNIKQRHIFLCYLNYVIGKTMLFKATDIPLAHKHLMEARSLCLNIIGHNSDLADSSCSYLGTDTDDIPHMKSCNVRDAFNSFCEIKMPSDFIAAYVFGKYRNERDVHILRKESKIETLCKHGYLTQTDYSLLLSIKPSLVMPLDLISKGFLGELMLHILFDNGRALDELLYEAKLYEHAKKGRDFEFKTCIEFTNLMKSRTDFENYPLLRYLVFDRGEQAYKLDKDDKLPSVESVKSRISEIRKVKGRSQKHYFQFGILKTSTEENEYHNCVCYRLLLKYHQQLYKISKSNEILSDGRNDMEEFLQILLKIEKDEKHNKWVEMPKFFIQCAKVLHMSTNYDDCMLAIEIYEKAINIEVHKGVYLTRYVWQANYGKALCLLLLERKDEANIIYHQLRKRLEGTHQTDRIKKLKDLFDVDQN